MKANPQPSSTVSHTTDVNDVFADPAKDKPKKQPLEVLTENDFRVAHKDEDPYGFFWISRERGQVPAELSGAFTSIEYARQAVLQYLKS